MLEVSAAASLPAISYWAVYTRGSTWLSSRATLIELGSRKERARCSCSKLLTSGLALISGMIGLRSCSTVNFHSTSNKSFLSLKFCCHNPCSVSRWFLSMDYEKKGRKAVKYLLLLVNFWTKKLLVNRQISKSANMTFVSCDNHWQFAIINLAGLGQPSGAANQCPMRSSNPRDDATNNSIRESPRMRSGILRKPITLFDIFTCVQFLT